MKTKLKKIYDSQYFELLLIFLSTFLITMTCWMSLDEIWNYGFAYNISNGLIPYKNFNMVVTPLYSMIQAIFLILFGNNMLVFHVVNALICTFIFSFLKKLFPKVAYLLYLILLSCINVFSNLYPSYNVLIFLFVLIILFFEKKSSNKFDLLIGIMIGLIFITKQNIGILLFFPTIFLFNMKRIIKRLLGFIIPCFSLIGYLLCTNSFEDFINYAFLGIASFKENLSLGISFYIFLAIIICCVYQILFKKNHDSFWQYSLCFAFICYPIFDFVHVVFPLMLVTGYLLDKFNYQEKYLRITFYIVFIISFVIRIITTDYIFISNNSLKYRLLTKETYNYMEQLSRSTKDYFKDDNVVYFLDDYAYFFKLYNDIEINKYDLINEGNMGLNGHLKYIEEIDKTCNEKKCVFIIKNNCNEETQVNQEILNYVKNNYSYNDTVLHLDIYYNY